MSKTEIDKFAARIKSYGKKVASSKKKSEDFLYKIGVTTKEGELSIHYKNLCTPPDRV